jgi:hypothetical protein
VFVAVKDTLSGSENESEPSAAASGPGENFFARGQSYKFGFYNYIASVVHGRLGRFYIGEKYFLL